MILLCVLAIVSAFSPSLKNAYGYNQEQNNAAETDHKTSNLSPPKSTAAEDRIANYTLALAVLTGALVLFGWYQARLLGQQIRLGRDEFTAANPPRLIVRRVYQDRTGVMSFIVVNIGKGAAYIISSDVRASQFTNDVIPQPLIMNAENTNPVKKPVIQPGEAEVCTGNAPEEAGYPLYFFGYVKYRDSAGTERTTWFLRKQASSSTRFVHTGDQDYEYQD